MTSIMNDFTNDLDEVWFDVDGFAQSATYRRKGSQSTTSLLVLLEQVRDETIPVARDGLDYYANQGRLWCKAEDVDNPIAGDVFTINGVDWIVQEILGGARVVWELVVYASARAGGAKK
jgi:hypothetical protein